MDTKVLTPIEGPSAWYGAAMAEEPDQWLYELDAAAIAEIDDAVAALTAANTPLLEVGKENFPLPTLGPALDGIQDEVVNGRGFVLIRGLPVDSYTIEEAALAYLGTESPRSSG